MFSHDKAKYDGLVMFIIYGLDEMRNETIVIASATMFP